MSTSDRVFFRISGSHLNVGTSEETILQLPTPGGGPGIWLLKAFHYVITGGSYNNWQPRVGQAAGFTSGGIDERLQYDSMAKAAGDTSVNDVYATDNPVKTDANGRLYFRPGFDNGSDNDGDYEFLFEYVRGG